MMLKNKITKDPVYITLSLQFGFTRYKTIRVWAEVKNAVSE